MGCISSKNVATKFNSPIRDPSIIIHNNNNNVNSSSLAKKSQNHNHTFKPLEKIKEETQDDKTNTKNVNDKTEDIHSNKHSKRLGISIRLKRSSEAEHVAAGWPGWLTAVAGEAVDGWVPLKSENFQKLEKIGEGTYSNVYCARDLQTGRTMALKKVLFGNLQPESVSFMAREINILRRLDHPNIMKLEGITISKLSCSIYLVFEYMEHDLSGLLSSPDVKFTDSQIKCFMWQLLKGIEHCHSRGVLHRDIKSSNILINNEGVLKIADFGLANFFNPRNKQQLTNRVVTLWYRPPELLLGSTSYGTYVDMWSVGCVFAELFDGRPILNGRTEVEQLHKIFKLCGTPSDEYWKKSRLPLAAMFRPHHAYESGLRERCKELPRSAVDLIYTLLSVEPEKRATARSALQAEYFYTKPYSCDPASMPTYPPNKEIDAKFREEASRKKVGGRERASGCSRNSRKVFKLVPEGKDMHCDQSRDSVNSKAAYHTVSDNSLTTEASQTDSICTLPAQANSSFLWETKRQEHLKRHQSLMKPDSICSTEVYDPHAPYDNQKNERFRHSGLMLSQSHSDDARLLDYYTRCC